MTNWIGTAQERFCHDYTDAVRASFIKCGIALPIDGSQDALINIRGHNNYTIPPWQSNPSLNPQRAHAASEAPADDSADDSDDDLDMDARAEEIGVMIGGT